MNATIGLFLLTIAFAAFALLFTLPKIMMEPFVKAYPYVVGVFAFAYLMAFALSPNFFDKVIAIVMLIICAITIDNRLNKEAKDDLKRFKHLNA